MIVNIPTVQAAALDDNISQQTERQMLGESDVEITTQRADESRAELQEKVIYTMEFRTSRYSTFSQKLESLSYSTGVPWELNPLVHSITVNISGERFDTYEVINLNHNTMATITPVLTATPWFTTYIAPIITLSPSELAAVGAVPFTPGRLTTYFFQQGGTRDLTEQEALRGITNEVNTTSGIKHYIAKETSEYLSYIKGRVANATLNGAPRPAAMQNILNANFVPIRYGEYPVDIRYTLPNATTPNSIKRYTIDFSPITQ